MSHILRAGVDEGLCKAHKCDKEPFLVVEAEFRLRRCDRHPLTSNEQDEDMLISSKQWVAELCITLKKSKKRRAS